MARALCAMVSAAVGFTARPAPAAYPVYNGIGTTGPLAWTERTNVAYAMPANGSALDTVDICAPVPAAAWRGPYPAVLLIHGGAWTSGSNAIGPSYTGGSSAWCQIWASWGFVAYSVGYRLQDGAAGNAWPAQLVDVQAAIRWVRNRAYSGNPDTVNPAFIGAMGDSAGASLALQLGVMAAIVPSPGDALPALWPTVNPQVQFVIAQFPPVHWGPASAAAPLPIRAIVDAESVNGGMAGLANSLFVQGTLDTLVDPIEPQSAYCYLKGHGNPTNYLSYVGGHEFTGIAGTAFGRIVGSVVTGAISFAINAGHYAPPGKAPPVPTSFAGPGKGFNDAVPPSCPYGAK